MILHLIRIEKLFTGIAGFLRRDDGVVFCSTLEHAYRIDCDHYAPKLPDGEYDCVRGMHQLEGMKEPFETFEITGVPNHTGILFHVGNHNYDSAGCVLVGKMLIDNRELLYSEQAFKEFMQLLNGISTFNLTVS